VNRMPLNGCRADVLAGYLQALGLLRALATQTDPDARLHWSGDVPVLHTCLARDDLLTWLTEAYVPAPIVSPWNSGSGFAGNGKSKSAEQALAEVRDSPEPRFSRLREAILAGERVVAEGRRRGWGGKKDELWAKEHKADVVGLCRATLPDDALPWLDVAVTLTLDDLAFNAIVGTGGNFGRQELVKTYYERLLTLMGPAANRKRSREWAEAALLGREDVPYLRDTVGQYDPGRAGGIHSSPDEKGDGFANPWSFVLVMEGTLLFAASAVRRNAASRSVEAKPFFTRATPLGHGSAAEDEATKGEQWAPLWDRSAGLAEITHLIGEGRAQWGGRHAASGLEFAMALASLGVDRGLTGFRRYVIAERLGQNPLAIPAGRVTVVSRPEERLVGAPYKWIARLNRMQLPKGVATAVRRVEREMFDLATGGGPASLARFVIEFGRLHEAVARSGALRSQIKPYRAESPQDWLATLDKLPEGREELWLAAGIASLRDDGSKSGPPIRSLLTRVRDTEWVDAPATGLDLYGATLVRALAEAHRLRMIAISATSANTGDDANPTNEPAVNDDATVRGVQTAYPHGQWLPTRLVDRFARGEVDDDLIADYLRGLLALDYDRQTKVKAPLPPWRTPDPALSLLLPFFGPDDLTFRVLDRTTGNEVQHKVRLAPRPEWIPRLIARGVPAIADDALLRLRLAGLPPVVSRLTGASPPTRLAAALLMPVSPHARERAVARVCAVKTVPRDTDQSPETPEGGSA